MQMLGCLKDCIIFTSRFAVSSLVLPFRGVTRSTWIIFTAYVAPVACSTARFTVPKDPEAMSDEKSYWLSKPSEGRDAMAWYMNPNA